MPGATLWTLAPSCARVTSVREKTKQRLPSSQVPLVAYQHSTRQMAPADGWYYSYSSSGGLTREPRPFVCPSYSDAHAFSMRGQSPAAPALLVDLQLMVFFYPRSAENRTFRPPVTQKQKNHFKFLKRLKIVEISIASGPWSQPQRHALPLPVSN